jgi:hypothetical protein
MIIGNDSNKNFNINGNFQKNINNSVTTPNNQNMHSSNSLENVTKRNVFTKDIFSIEGGNTSSEDDMYNKSLAMLNDRLEKGLITMDEFSKKCNDIAKKRNNL